MNAVGGYCSSGQLLKDQAPQNFPIKPKHEGRRISQGTHVELATVFLCKMNTLNSEPIKFFQPGANSWNFKGGVSGILVELEQLREKAVGEEIFLQEGQVACLGMRELCIKIAGFGLHDREAWFPN